MRPLRSNLTAEILGLVLLIVIAPALGLFAGGYLIAEAAVREVVDEQVGRSLDATERRVSDAVYGLLELSARIADDAEARRVLSEAARPAETAGSTALARTRRIDAAIGALTVFYANREDIRFTIVDPEGGLFTNWSRNLRDYSGIERLTLAARAREARGHAVWEGFEPSYIVEEREAGAVYLSVARAFPDIEARPGREPLLILGLSGRAFSRILSEGAAGGGGTARLDDGRGREISWTGAGAGGGTGAGGGFFPFSRTYVSASRAVRQLPQDLKDPGWTLSAEYEFRSLAGGFARTATALMGALGVLLAAAIALSFAISRVFVRPVVSLARRMDDWSLEGADAPSEAVRRADEIGALERSFAGMRAKIRELFDSSRREHALGEAYRLRALRSRLNPHFLFNSMSAIRFMALIRKADNIAEAVDALGTMLRYAMSKEGPLTSLAEELANLDSYVFIQNARFGGRFSLTHQVPQRLLGERIPRFVLQPAVENAVVHGYRDMQGPGEILVAAEAEGGFLEIRVTDRGRGMDAETIARVLASAAEDGAEDGGIGLPIVREMLRAACGEGASLAIESREGQGTTVAYRLPLPAGDPR